MNEAWQTFATEGFSDEMDAVDYDPDSLAREARAPQPPPESEALQQMLSEALNREMILRAEIIRLRRAAPG
jgi:hypothetical protein